MTKQRPRPWHEVVRLKDELRSGELSLAEFAADLHEVTLQQGRRPVYEEPEKFFGLTFPTYALRELVKDVATRLAGKSDKAVRQLELTYGGGKTHTLIALFHLFRDPDSLPDLAAVREFREHAAGVLTGAHVAALCFDKIDVERGIEGVRSPDGETRSLRHPWSVLAYQLGGDDALRAISGEGGAEERETPPAEPLLVKLLELPRERGLGTLVLVDEVLMYAREKAGHNQVWRDRIMDFFQYLVQATTRVDRAALVASLLATDPAKQQGETGQLLIGQLSDVFRRQKEEGVQPVGKDDVGEVLRRRFFTPASLRDKAAWRPQSIGAVRELARLEETVRKARKAEEERFEAGFPFHPDLTDLFYSKWTQLPGFQRTRGILRTLAMALRGSEPWDESPLVGLAALLRAPGEQGIADPVRELAGVATPESGEGARTDWPALLEKELEIARDVQNELPALAVGREVEQAVVAVFLGSQPTGSKLATPELLRLTGAGGPDGIVLRKGLLRWRELSWFLDDEDAEGGPDPEMDLPRSWRLGNRPNLRQMHDQACRDRVTVAAVDGGVEDAIRKAAALTDGARAAGAIVHRLPRTPGDVGDDDRFRYVLLGPRAASESGKPSALGLRYLAETTGADRPRVHRNAVVLAVPSRDGLEILRGAVRSLLGWEEVRSQLRGQSVDPVRRVRLDRSLEEGRARIREAVRQAYRIVVAMGADGQPQAFKLPGAVPKLFLEIKGDERSRIQETAVDAEALLPDGPWDLWREGEDSRLVKDLAGAFARYPHLPRMLRARAIRDTVLQGVERGLLVARLNRPDGSGRTWWRESVPPESANDPSLEVVLPEKAVLDRLGPELLAPNALPGLWPEDGGGLPFAGLARYFGGGFSASVPREGYEDMVAIPSCPAEAIEDAVRRAVEEGIVWLRNGPTSVWKEEAPPGVLDDDATLAQPPADLIPQDLTEEALADAWANGETNGAALALALNRARKDTLPWMLVREGIENAVRGRWLEVKDGNTSVRLERAGAVVLGRPEAARPPTAPPRAPGVEATLDLVQLQDLGGRAPELMQLAAGCDVSFRVVAFGEETSENVRKELANALREIAGEAPPG